MQVYRTNDRSFLVRGFNSTHVLYDVVFTKNDAQDRQTIEDEFPHLNPDRDMRSPARFLSAPVDKFAVRLARLGHLIKDAPKSAYVAIENAGIKL